MNRQRFDELMETGGYWLLGIAMSWAAVELLVAWIRDSWMVGR